MGNDAQVVYPKSMSDFKALLSNSTFVVVDFSADWCPPCKAVHPLYVKLASTSSVPGHLTFASIDVDEVPDVSLEYSVSAMPTFLFFAEGNLAAVDTNGAVKASTSPGAIMEQDRVKGIRGVDPRALVAVVGALKRAADARAKASLAKDTTDNAAEAKKEATAAEDSEKKPAEDEKTVSGGYTLGTDGGKRADWKMSLNA
jgi:thioredoxin 1